MGDDGIRWTLATEQIVDGEHAGDYDLRIKGGDRTVQSITQAIEAADDGTERRGDASPSEALCRALLDAAPDAMVIVGEDRRIVLVNAEAEKLFGYGRGELLGQPAEMLVPERHRTAWGAASLSGLRRNGTEFAAEVRLSTTATPDGTLAIASVRDVTERDRTRKEALANLNHDLRSPLNAIMGFAGLMHNGKLGPISTSHKEYLGDILNNANELLQCINDAVGLGASPAKS
jgi:protein-histidine pros-kinase